MDETPLTGGVLTWAEWRRIYELIVADFGFDPDADRAARDELGELVGPDTLEFGELPTAAGRTVAIVGAAPSLDDELGRVADADIALAASSAASVLDDAGLTVDVVVTDLDGDPDRAVSLADRGAAVAVHAHGDNRSLLREWVPRFDPDRLFPTTQVRPTDRVANPGGFTDGDRAAFLAAALGAGRLTFAGWEFDDPDVSAIKRRKLRWAARLLRWLERRRGERFSVLDGRRAGVDLAGFPPAEPD